MLEALRKLVDADSNNPSSERIDSVLWDIEGGSQPNPADWKALDGLSPKHLTMSGGFYEDCNIVPLRDLHHQWTDLQGLTFVGMASNQILHDAPSVISLISSLTLDYCCGLHYVHPNAANLADLVIIGNNACDMFISGIDDNPTLAHTLETLEVVSGVGGTEFSYDYDPEDFRDALRKCTNLRTFRFRMAYEDDLATYLASDIPSSVEHLSLKFERSVPLLHYFDDWIEKASSTAWLPALKTLKMIVDPEKPVAGLAGSKDTTPWIRKVDDAPDHLSSSEFDQEFERKRSVFYLMLKNLRPSVELFT